MKKIFCIVIMVTLSHPAFATSIPMRLNQQYWQTLEYDNIPANRVSQTEQGLQIQVNSSASPLIYVFDKPETIRDISVMGTIGKLPEIPPGLKQGEKGADDFPFRLGLVLEGKKTLNFAQKLIAAQWVRILFALAPEETGIDHIMFLNLANPGVGPISGAPHPHPGGKGLFTETIIKQIAADESFDFSYTLPKAEKVIALWISSDGDDTGSTYTLTIESISYD